MIHHSVYSLYISIMGKDQLLGEGMGLFWGGAPRLLGGPTPWVMVQLLY